MDTKHTPATPLPWITGRVHPTAPVAYVDTKSGDEPAVCYHDVTGENSAYIVHACNAYPRLVKTLRALTHPAPRRNAASDACELLHELGEDE